MRFSTPLKSMSPLIAVAILLGGCGSLDLDVRESASERNTGVRDQEVTSAIRQNNEPGLFGGEDGFSLFGGGDEEAKGAGVELPVNRYLWRGTLDTLSFLPLTSTDPYGGVIVTDWGAAPDSPGERFKVTAYITSAALKPQSLNVVVNRQTKAANGSWVSAPVAADTARSLEDAILTRARQLRTADDKGAKG